MQKNSFIKIVIRVLLVSPILCFTVFTYGQENSLERLPPRPPEAMPPSYGETRSYLRWGTDGLKRGLSYSSVSGSPFWNDDWKLATLFGRTPKEIWICKTKLNLATGEIYYLNNEGEERVLDNGIIKKIIFYNDDSATAALFISSEQAMLLNERQVIPYLQVLNNGKYQLLKLTTCIVSSKDSMLGTLKRYYFLSQTKYYVSDTLKTDPIKRLKKENILVYLPNSSQYNNWMVQNKIDFRKEKDILTFFNYYNSQTGKK